MPKKSITMTAVARQAGVSISTVSRVVNGSVNVSDQLKKQVEASIAELNYEPIRIGSAYSALATIAVMIPNINSPFFHKLIQGMQAVCFENGRTLQIYSSGDDPEKEMIHADELLLRSDIKGVIFAGAWTWDYQEPILKLEEAGKPICLINRFAPTVRADLLEVDRVQGTFYATEHLLQLGHTRIGCITGIPNAATHPDRVKGFRRALTEYQIKVDEDLICETSLSAEGGYRAGLKLLGREDYPSADLGTH